MEPQSHGSSPAPPYGPADSPPHGSPSREEIARREIGVTRVTRPVALALCAGFVALMTAIPLFEIARAAGGDSTAAAPWTRLAMIPSDARTREGLFDRNRAVLEGLHAFEDSLEDESRIGQTLRPWAQLVVTGKLGAGNEQAYAGQDGWLFYRPDVEYVTGRGFLQSDVLDERVRAVDEWMAPPQPDPRPPIVELHRDLAARGVLLIVVPVPLKPTVHPEMLTARGVAAFPQNPDYVRFVEDIRRDGVQVFDVTSVLRPLRAASDASLYLAADTHWRPEAMERVAEALADAITRSVGLAVTSNPDYLVSPVDIVNRGDTFAMLDLPVGQRLFPEETVTIRRILHRDGSAWAPSRDADVLVLGDSFANIYSLESLGWGTSAGLVEQLSFSLGRPLDRMVQNDAGAYATREMLARADPERLAPKRIVVYQFAVRELAFGDWKRVDGSFARGVNAK